MIYLIATRHDEYAKRKFPAGSTVIDPWRYIPDQEGVRVQRLGENKPDLISILCPTRGRANQFRRLCESAFSLATHPKRVEIVAYLDEDDPAVYDYPSLERVIYLQRPRILLSEAWNECYLAAQGPLYMHCGDDIVFRTEGWDAIVRQTFAQYPDKIVLVHGDDMSPNTDALATHGFVHRRWVQTLGYFVPPYFSSDWNDVWLTEIADAVGRRVKVPIVTEHMHYAFGKAERDQNTNDREERGARDNVVEIYERKASERKLDADKLAAVIT